MALTDSADILFRIKGDASDAVRAFNQTETAENQLTGATGGLASAFGGLLNPATLIVSITTALASAAVAGTIALFNLAQSAAEYGGDIYDASQKTGLGVEKLQALKFAADQSGVSFEAITKSVQKFTVLIGQAQLGNEKAEATLKKYGITAKDTEEALIQAIETVTNLTSEEEQNAAAAELFKDKAGNMIQVIREMGGDLPAVIEKLRDMGLLMSREDAKAADEFGDQMDLLNKQLSAIGRTIGIEVMPVFTQLARDLSNWLKENPGQIESWAKAIKISLQAVVGTIRLVYNWYASLFDLITTSGSAIYAFEQRQFDQIKSIVADFQARQEERQRIMADILSGKFAWTPDTSPQATGATGRPDFARLNAEDKKAAEERAKERQDIEKRNAAAQVQILRTQLDQQIAEYERFYDRIGDRVLAGEDPAKLAAEAQKRTNVSYDEMLRTIQLLNTANDTVADNEKKTYAERQLAALQHAKLIEDLDKRRTAAIDKSTKEIERILKLSDAERERELKKKAEDEEKRITESIEADARRSEAFVKNIEKENKLLQEQADISETLRKDREARHAAELENVFGPPEEPPAFFGEGGFGEGLDAATGHVRDLSDVMTNLGAVAEQVFMQFGEGLGNMVEQWVLLGDQADVSMSKMIAVVLAGLAKQAATLAVFHLAMGIVALTPWGALMYGPAVNHFIAAAMWGGIAASAAVVGRAVAGDQFQNNKKGGAVAPSGTGQGSGRGQGSVYSSFGDKAMVQEYGRLTPADREMPPVRVVISIKDKPDWFDDMFQTSISQNGRTREILRDTVG